MGLKFKPDLNDIFIYVLYTFLFDFLFEPPVTLLVFISNLIFRKHNIVLLILYLILRSIGISHDNVNS
ncbi:hypothetical protein C1645_188005 [Glomus cerebriforme]|uniref:Uncharacterized protein n=1 Tax=Glomus cerebriforme TaxID=658196 RepID=A0A397T030_9GLOM|nr:hypothetical protein C1645_188005 [Glomus cerebriforme]